MWTAVIALMKYIQENHSELARETGRILSTIVNGGKREKKNKEEKPKAGAWENSRTWPFALFFMFDLVKNWPGVEDTTEDTTEIDNCKFKCFLLFMLAKTSQWFMVALCLHKLTLQEAVLPQGLPEQIYFSTLSSSSLSFLKLCKS